MSRIPILSCHKSPTAWGRTQPCSAQLTGELSSKHRTECYHGNRNKTTFYQLFHTFRKIMKLNSTRRCGFIGQTGWEIQFLRSPSMIMKMQQFRYNSDRKPRNHWQLSDMFAGKTVPTDPVSLNISYPPEPKLHSVALQPQHSNSHGRRHLLSAEGNTALKETEDGYVWSCDSVRFLELVRMWVYKITFNYVNY